MSTSTGIDTAKNTIKDSIDKLNNKTINLDTFKDTLQKIQQGTKAPTKNELQKMVDDVTKHIDLKLGSFIIPIIMYIASFPYTLNNKTSEYVAWILITFLNVVFPFTFVKELMALTSKNVAKGATSGYAMVYSTASIIIAYLLQFIALLFVVLKNENIRRSKQRKGDYENEGRQNLDTNERSVERRDRIISTLFITGSVLVWAMVSNHFAYDLRPEMFMPTKEQVSVIDSEKDLQSNIFTPVERMQEMFPVGSKIHWFVRLIPNLLLMLDGYLHTGADMIPLDPLSKGALVYAASFIVILFSAFIRIKYEFKRTRIEHDGYIRYEKRLVQQKGEKIVNIYPLFGTLFYNNLKSFRNLAKVSLVFLMVIICIMIILFFMNCISLHKETDIKLSDAIVDIGGNNFTWQHLIFGISFVIMVVCFPVFFAERKSKFLGKDSKNKIQQLLFKEDEKYDYFSKNPSEVNVQNDETIIVYYNQSDLYDGKINITASLQMVQIKQVIADVGYYFKTYVFPTYKDTVIYTAGGTDYIDINGNHVKLDEAWGLLVTKYENVNGFDVSIESDKEKDYDNFKLEFKSIMEQIYGSNHTTFKIDRDEYMDMKKFTNRPFIFEESDDFKGKNKTFNQNKGNMELKRYFFFLICLFFGFLASPVLLAILELLFRSLPGLSEIFAQRNEKLLFERNIHLFSSNKYWFNIGYIIGVVALTLIMFGIGVDKPNENGEGNNLLFEGNNKQMKTFLAILWSMMGASFFALSTQFNMFTALWTGPGTLISVMLKTVSPIAIMLFAALSLMYAFKNYKRFRNGTSE